MKRLKKRHPFRWSIGNRIAIILLVVVFVVLYLEIALVLVAIAERKQATQLVLENSCLQLEQTIQEYLFSVENTVDALANSPQVQLYLSQPEVYSQQETPPLERLKHLQGVMHSAAYGKQNVDSVYVLQKDYRIKVVGRRNYSDVFYAMNREYGLMDLKPEEEFYTGTYFREHNKAISGYFRPVSPVNMEGGSYQQEEPSLVGILFILDGLQKTVQSAPSGETLSHEVLVVDNGEVIVASNPDRVGSLWGWEEQKALTESHSLVIRQISAPDWTIYAIEPTEAIYRAAFYSLKETLAVGAISLILLLAVGTWIVLRLTKPIAFFVKDIEKTDKDIAKASPLGQYGLKEIDIAAAYVNELLYRIHVENEKLLLSQRSLLETTVRTKEAELAFYQAQINPHFLYNTLGCIGSISQLGNQPEITTMAFSMSEIFRYSSKERAHVFLSEEIQIAKQYFKIIQIRFDDKFALITQIAPETLGAIIPKMILQPLLENSISHGLSQMVSGGQIVVKAYCVERQLFLEVQDNGVGIESIRLSRLKGLLKQAPSELSGEHKSIGLLNIHHRIQLEYGESYGVTLTSQKGKGTIIILTLPLQQSEDNP